MQCHQARIRLEALHWQAAKYTLDNELVDHLSCCQECSSLVRAEQALHADLEAIRQAQPATDLSIAELRLRTEESQRRSTQSGVTRGNFAGKLAAVFVPRTRARIVMSFALVALVFIALVPLDIRQKVGYQIAIDGVEKDIAMENPKITSLLGALGMEQQEATNLLDSLGMNQIHFAVGDCSETCRLTIFDLKTERDVQLMVQAIIDLGCCRIDNVAPVFRNESMSLLGLATRKLLS